MSKEKPVRKLRIRAIRDFVIVKPHQELEYKNRIVIPLNALDEKNPPSGIVISVGTGLVEGGTVIPLVVKVGDHVSFPPNSGTLIKDSPIFEDCFVVRENQIFGVGE